MNEQLPSNDVSSSTVVSEAVRVRRVITTRTGGQSTGRYSGLNLSLEVGDNPVTVAHNREKVAHNIGLDLSRFVWMGQIDGPHVAVVENTHDILPGTSRLEIENVDAVITTCVNLPLVVLTADAVPLLLGDDEAGVIAAVNASKWGVRAGIVANTLTEMQRLGARLDHTHALLGPSATGKHQLLTTSQASDLEQRIPHSTTRISAHQWAFDLRSGVVHYLLEAGLAGVNLDPRCTVKDRAFYSVQREGKTGRQAGIIWRSTS